MGTLSMRGVGLVAAGVMMLLTVGCSTTKVTFRGPPGAVLIVDDKPYHLPAQVELARPGDTGDTNRYDVSLAFTSGQSQEVRAKGNIAVYGYAESEADRYAVNTCELDEPNLLRVLEGTTVIFKGQSASRQPLYELTLVKQ